MLAAEYAPCFSSNMGHIFGCCVSVPKVDRLAGLNISRVRKKDETSRRSHQGRKLQSISSKHNPEVGLRTPIGSDLRHSRGLARRGRILGPMGSKNRDVRVTSQGLPAISKVSAKGGCCGPYLIDVAEYLLQKPQNTALFPWLQCCPPLLLGHGLISPGW